MTSLHICFTKYPVKSQPEVGLSQDLFDFGHMGHDFSLPSKQQKQQEQFPLNAIDIQGTNEPAKQALSSFGSFSSAADSLVHDNAIVIPAYSPPLSTSSATINTSLHQDFCLLDDQDPVLMAPLVSSVSPSSVSSSREQHYDSSTLLSSSVCESDISFCSPATPLNSLLSPYGFAVDDMMMVPSPSSSPCTWLANTMQTGLSLHSPQPSPSFLLDSPGVNALDQQCAVYSPSPSSTAAGYMLTNLMNTPQQLSSDSLASTDMTMAMLMTEQQSIKTNKCKSTKKKPTKKKSAVRRREYGCPYCPRKSNRSNNMKEHILTHDPNRPKNFHCTVCPKRFARKHDLKRHHQSHERSIQKIMIACGLAPGSS